MKKSRSFKSFYGFSLIELLISLIIISLVAASFVPILSKKLKRNHLSLSNAKQITTECSHTGLETCKLCYKNDTNCLLKICLKTCANNEYAGTNCDCHSCKNDKFTNKCLTCTQETCLICESGYKVQNKSCIQITCPKGQYVSGQGCSNCPNNTIQPNDNSTSSSCSPCSDNEVSNSNKTQCIPVTCSQAQYRSGRSCYNCTGSMSYQDETNHSQTSCKTCGANQLANSSHTGCYSTCVSASSCTGNQALLDGCHCSNCASGTHPNITRTSCDADVIVCTGATYRDASTNTCKNCPSHCTSCTAGNNCSGCESGWHLNSNNTGCDRDIQTLYPSVENCAKINAIYVKKEYNGTGGVDVCVSKYNLGDTNGPTIATSTDKRTVGGSQTDTCSNCCWSGKTASACTDNGKASEIIKNFDYSGCYRTVCTWQAASDGCANYQYKNGNVVANDWRLPKESELAGWASNINNLSKKIGTDGLQFCDHEKTAKRSPVCYGENGKCKGAFDGDCRPRRVWSDSSSIVYALENGDFRKQTSDLKSNTAASVRCVIEKFYE